METLGLELGILMGDMSLGTMGTWYPFTGSRISHLDACTSPITRQHLKLSLILDLKISHLDACTFSHTCPYIHHDMYIIHHDMYIKIFNTRDVTYPDQLKFDRSMISCPILTPIRIRPSLFQRANKRSCVLFSYYQTDIITSKQRHHILLTHFRNKEKKILDPSSFIPLHHSFHPIILGFFFFFF
jgi:hypothetical protein